MLIQPQFEIKEKATIHELIATYPLATFITDNAGAPNINHIPLLLETRDGKDFLTGHIARNNFLWQEHDCNKDVIAVFQGENAYISPAWYATKSDTGKVVPTWNYVSVHARGAIRFIHDASWILTHLNTLTNYHEQSLAHPWRVDDAPDEYIQRLTQMIVGVEIEVKDLKGKWKLSQNRPAQDRTSVIAALEKSGNTKMAQLIKAFEPS
jgi:transcriptional regulator